MSRILHLPAPVDPHVHLRDLDWAHKGTFTSETSAALAGGYSAVLDMPNTPPSTVNSSALMTKLTVIAAGAVSDWGVYFGAGHHISPDDLAQASAHVCGLKIYCNDTTGDLLVDDQHLRAAHFAAWRQAAIGRPIALHAEGETVAEMLTLVREYRVPTHFCHISTAYEIDLLAAARQEGLPVTVGVTPHHLYLTQADVSALGPYGLMKPLLKTPADRDALWKAIDDGIVDVIESDHAPHTLAEKTSERTFYGVPGLETTLPLLGLAVHEGRITAEQMIALTCENPRRIFHIPLTEETYTRFDLDDAYTLDNARLHTQCGWTPFDGLRVYGRVLETWVRGRRCFGGEHVLAAPGTGVNVRALP